MSLPRSSSPPLSPSTAVGAANSASGPAGCPVLALGGTLDTQVDARRNLATVREAIPGAEVHEMDGLNHLFQHAATGDTAEYGTICETLAPEVLALVGDFVLRQR